MEKKFCSKGNVSNLLVCVPETSVEPSYCLNERNAFLNHLTIYQSQLYRLEANKKKSAPLSIVLSSLGITEILDEFIMKPLIRQKIILMPF